MKINVHNKNLELIGILDNDSQYTINYAEDKWTRTLATGSSVYEFTAFYKKLNYADEYSNPFNNLKVGNYVSFKHNGEDFLFKIMSTEKNGKEVYCYCENLNLELRNELVGSFDSSDKARTLEGYIKEMKLLEYTNMSLGVNEVNQLTKKLSFTNDETKLARLLNVLSEFGAEHRFFTKLNPNGTIKEFKLDIFKKQNADGEGGYGKKVEDVILRKGVNVQSVKEKEEILNLWNATRPVGKKTIQRVELKKTPVKNEEQVVVSSNMVNSNGTLSIENIQTILKLCYEYRVLPSGVISQLYLESFWGNSNVARVDNNWSGMTWTGNPNRPSGVVVSQGSARPSSEGGHYMHFANLSDFFKDYFYLLAKQGIYNVANKNNISDYTRGLFRVGGAAYDYAAAGYDHYNSLMTGIRNGINAKNGNVLDKYDEDWKNPKVITTTTTVVEQKGAPNTKRVLSELASMAGKTLGNGQCYGLASWYSNKLGGAGLGAGIGGFSGLVGSGIRACDIGTDYNWRAFGWAVDGGSAFNTNLVAGAIINIKANYGAPWYTGYYGHTAVVESVNGNTITILQQNYAGAQYVTRQKYQKGDIISSIQTIVHPPELASGGRVEGTGNVVIKEDGKDKYVNLELPTDVKTTEETIDIYIDSEMTRYWYDKNNNLEFHLVNGALYADQSAQMFPTTFTSYDNEDKWIRRDFEYQVDSEEELIEVALADLKANCYPSLTYEIEGFFQTDIGNTHLIEDPDFEPMLTLRARVTEQEISFSNPDNNKTTFSNYVKLESEVPDALVSRLQQLIDASIPYEIRVAASNGTSFKNNEGESEITVELLKSGITQEAEFFFKNGDSIVGKGTKLLVKASDFDNVLNLTIEAYVNNSLAASKPITFTDVEDGAQGPQGPQGEQGPQGPKGDRGEDGVAGKDGVGLKSTVVTYGLSTSETVKPIAWYPQVPTLKKGMYLWTETVWTYTDNTSETGYQKTYIAKDGNDGNDGLPGKDGVGIVSTVITYAGSTSGTTKPTSGWTSTIPSVPDGQYLWTKTVWTYTDETTETGYSVAKMGEKGEDGRGLERLEDFYQLTSTSTAPNYPDVGGRNLLKNSKTLEGSNIIGAGTNLSEKYEGCTVRYIKSKNGEDILQFSNCVTPEPSSTYTVSFWAKGTAPFKAYFWGNSNYLEVSSGLTSQNVSTTAPDGGVIFTPTGSWERFWVTYKLKDSYPTSDTSVAKHFLFRQMVSDTVETEQYIAGVKLESGKIPTDYTEAPEDLGWSTDVKVPTNDNRFLWKFSINYFSDGTVAFTPATLAGSMGAQGLQGLQGPKGDQGLPGEPGADGRTQYTHIAYADDENGGGFSQTDQNKAYIGMYVDFTATDSNDPTKYKWSKWRGEDGAQGIPGKPGADGKTPYIHFAYADDDKGTNFSLTDKNQQYQGYYSDYTEADSTDYRRYKWVDRLANVQVGGVNLYALSQNNSIRKKDISEFTQNISTGEISFKVTGPDPFFGDQANKGDAFRTSRGVKIPVKAGQGIAVFLTNELLVKNYVSYFGEDNNAVKDFKNYQANKFVIPASELDGVSYVTFRFGFTEWSQEVGSVHKTKIKVEHGNIYTTWSPAPEDTQEQVDNKADQALTQDQLNALAEKNALIQAEMEAKASIDTVNQWIIAYQNYVKANDADKKKSEQALQDASNRLLQVKYDVNDLKQQWNFIDTYMSVQNEGLIIGKKDGSAYAKFSNDRISLFSGNSEVMYISQGTLNIANGIFTKTIQIGRFRFETHPSDADMLVVRFLGG